jgi:hypothetical protein
MEGQLEPRLGGLVQQVESEVSRDSLQRDQEPAFHLCPEHVLLRVLVRLNGSGLRG